MSIVKQRPLITTLKESILQLWNECRNPEYIAAKLNILDENGEYDTGEILCIVENPANYPSRREYLIALGEW